MHRDTWTVGCACRHEGHMYSIDWLLSLCRSQHRVQIAWWHPKQAAGSSKNCVQTLQQKQSADLYASPQQAKVSKQVPCSANLSKMSTGRCKDIVGGVSSGSRAHDGRGA